MFDMQDFCNFFALRQQHTVLIRDAPQNHDENHVHKNRRNQRAEADDGIRIRQLRSSAAAKNVAAPMMLAAAAGRITLRKIAGRVVTDRRMAMRSSTVMVT